MRIRCELAKLSIVYIVYVFSVSAQQSENTRNLGEVSSVAANIKAGDYDDASLKLAVLIRPLHPTAAQFKAARRLLGIKPGWDGTQIDTLAALGLLEKARVSYVNNNQEETAAYAIATQFAVLSLNKNVTALEKYTRSKAKLDAAGLRPTPLLLYDTGKAALDAGFLDESIDYINRELAAFQGNLPEELLGAFRHRAYTVVGAAYLRKGDIAGAIDSLNRSLKVPAVSLGGSGPSMYLANLLLDHGQDDAVIGYLRKCEELNTDFRDKQNLSLWRNEIEYKVRPDFHLALHY